MQFNPSFKYITYEHYYQINKYNIDANLDTSETIILVNEPSSEMLTSKSQKLERTSSNEYILTFYRSA